MLNAYDLRKGKYRYLRGDSSYVDEVESFYENSVLMPSGMAAISLVFQFLISSMRKRPTIWFPHDLYEGTLELVHYLGLNFDDKSPDIVIYDYPSFSGKKYHNYYDKAIVIVDNSLNPLEEPDCDFLVTSLSKYHTNCQTVLGLIRCSGDYLGCTELLKRLRWKSGYVIFKEQADAFLQNRAKYSFEQFSAILNAQFKICKEISNRLVEFEIESVVSGGCIFLMVPDSCDEKKMAFLTSFHLCPTYGSDKTLCCYSYCEDNYRYFGNYKRIGKWLRISPGFDYSVEYIVNDIVKAYYSCLDQSKEVKEDDRI